jgi:hypothetical protein
MKIKLTYLIFCLLFTFAANGQNTIAKIKYEEAEEAYMKEDYPLALKKLNEAETILKATNPRIMYLRIMAQSEIIRGNFDPYQDFSILQSTRNLLAKYLKDYESIPNNEDKYKDVYKVSERLIPYPNTLAEIEADRNRPIKLFTETENVLQFFKFKPGLTIEEFKAYNTQAANLVYIPWVFTDKDSDKKRARLSEIQSWANVSAREGLFQASVEKGKVTAAEFLIKESMDYKDNWNTFNKSVNVLINNLNNNKINIYFSDGRVSRDGTPSPIPSVTGIYEVTSDYKIWYSLDLDRPWGDHKYRVRIRLYTTPK